MTAAAAVAQFQMIELAKLGESSFNPRKTFDKKKAEELEASVAAKGVLEPLLVRPHGKVFEVVAGARRFRAAKAAKLERVPCLVRELTDVEAREVALIENVERESLSALDEGDAYRDLVKLGRTVDELVEKTGRSRTVVFQRMKLAELQGEARELIESGKWSASIGELIARLPTKEAQDGAMKRLDERCRYLRDGLAALSFREAKEILDREVVLHLKDATFDVKDAQLVPSAGACVACPKRTHHADNREAFKDVKVDTCIDGKCWNAKKAASFKLLQAELAEAGKKLVKEKSLVAAHHYGSGPAPFTAAAAEKYSKPGDEVIKGKTWKDLLGGEVPKVVVLDGDNKTHNLIDRKAALKLLEEKDAKLAAKVAEEQPEKEDDWEARREADQKKYAAQNAAHRVVRTWALRELTKLDKAVELLISSTDDWEFKNALKVAGVPASTKLEKLTPAQRASFLVAFAFRRNGSDAADAAAPLVKLDVKALTKKALSAEPGTCFQCTKPAPKAATLCELCGGEEA